MAVVDAVLLAAGESRRMGEPKQMLEVDGKPLLIRTIRVLQEAGTIRKIIVVLGANADRHLEMLSQEEVQIVVNQDWPKGMGSSIRTGLERLDPDNLPDGILITVCDQPLLSADIIRKLTAALKTNKIATAEYSSGVYGTPALFSASFLNELKSIPAEGGARQMFHRFRSVVTPVPFPEGSIDLDTPEDYRRFRENHAGRNQE